MTMLVKIIIIDDDVNDHDHDDDDVCVYNSLVSHLQWPGLLHLLLGGQVLRQQANL